MKRLTAHTRIALDIDETLIHGRTSALLRDWVLAAPDDVEMHLITFRSGAALARALYEISAFGYDAARFASLNGCPEGLLEDYSAYRALQEQAGADLSSSSALGLGRRAEDLIHWKGLTAASIGCTVLVDDLPHMVEIGCKVHGVAFVDAATLRLD